MAKPKSPAVPPEARGYERQRKTPGRLDALATDDVARAAGGAEQSAQGLRSTGRTVLAWTGKDLGVPILRVFLAGRLSTKALLR